MFEDNILKFCFRRDFISNLFFDIISIKNFPSIPEFFVVWGTNVLMEFYVFVREQENKRVR